jgi:intraflagellar transport protein 80
MDNFNGIQIYTYEGRLLCNPKFGGLRTEFMNYQSVSVSNDVVAIVDKGEGKSQGVRFFDANSGKQLGQVLEHTMEIMEIELNQFGNYSDRKLAFIDRNGDLYITNVNKHNPYKLATMVDSLKWNDQTDMLVAIADGRFVVWYYPNIVNVDRDLLHYIKNVKPEEYGKKAHIIDFFGTRCNIRKWDGSIATAAVSPHPLLLYELAEKKSWESAVRLCRFVKDKALWACLSAMVIKEKDNLNFAVVALGALEEVDKLQFITKIQAIPSTEGRNAEIALYMRSPDEAESILLQAGLYYRAIKMRIRMYHWSKALEIALRYKTHVDTVVAYRRRYLETFKREETMQAFLPYQSNLEINWTTIKEKIKQEKEKEKKK